MLEMLQEIICQQNGARGNCRQDVAGQFRLRNRKEQDWNDQPATREDSELQFQVRLSPQRFTLGPPGAERLHAGGRDENDPRHKRESGDWEVIPEGLGMMVKTGGETSQIVLDNKLAKELRILDLDRDVPGKRNHTE